MFDKRDYKLELHEEDAALTSLLEGSGTRRASDRASYDTLKANVFAFLRERGVYGKNARSMLRVLADQAKFMPARIAFHGTGDGGPRSLPQSPKQYSIGSMTNEDTGEVFTGHLVVLLRPIETLSNRVIVAELASYYRWWGDMLYPSSHFTLHLRNYPHREIGEGMVLV